MNHIVLFILGLAGFAFKFLFNTFLTRHLSSALFGDFSVALSVFNVVSAYMLFGTATSSIRFFSSYLKKNEIESASIFIAWNLRIVLISSLIFFVLLTLFTTMIMGLHLFHIYDIREYHLVVYFLWIAPLGALTLLFSSYLLCNRNVYLGTFFGANSLYLFGILLLIPATFIFDITLRIKSLWLLIFCVTTIIATIQSFILFFKMRDVLERSFSYFFKKTISDQARKKEWWEVSLRLIFNQFVYLIVSALDLILLEIIDPNEAVVGYYAAALTVTGLIWMTQLALFQHISPMISSSIETENDKKELQVLINKAQINNIVLNSILIALITIFTNPILKFFGPEYLAAKIPLWILLGATFISLLSTPASKLLAYSGNEKSLLFISILQVTTMLISGVILISLFGMIGAALAVMTTLLVRGIASIYFVRIKLAMRTVIFV